MKIPIAKPMFDENEMRAILEPLKSGWVSQGSRVQEFEKVFKAYVGTRHASAVNSGTAALHLALLTSGIGSSDEVITSPFTCVATANPIEYIGARPVFVDIELSTYNIDTSKIEEAITDKTKAILPVHLFGLCADMDSIMEIAQKYNLTVIEDAALALGSFYKNKHAGTFGEAGCFSFHPRKMITTGEGGMVVSSKERLASEIESLRNYGASVSAFQRHQKNFHVPPEYNVLGYNYKMTDLQASIGNKQVEKLGLILAKRKEIAQIYDKELKNLEKLILPSVPQDCSHSYQSYVCLFAPGRKSLDKVTPDYINSIHKERNEFMKKLEEKGIATVPGAAAVHTEGYYREKYGYAEVQFLNTLIANKLSIALPIYPQMTQEEQEYVITNIRNLLA